MSDDKEPVVREAVARNPNTNPRILGMLNNDPDVREMVKNGQIQREQPKKLKIK